ncbi:cyclic nucleotide-binding domain-containing protein [Thiobacillus sp.]|uniref:cyclic nucleotide-binding domain-containing protein n=1 Tax=Thiobacillus sp. TaxID=924 RepID=UPI0017E5CB81|nr:cyclic nucleotide-binding domain-containing protein [Thiobacillus sp.]MBC2732413.1 cyclic nucleotide-binding domain-containing protein [Thiobacillus sp.]MBC2741151.1 cyclic nucleotide-binding domain-containing protein [Thiobacillus sp.]
MSKIRICNTAEIPSNGMKDYDVEGGLKVLIANAGDCYYAYQGICPHQEVCLAEGYYDGAVLTCHQHLWQWDITTGKQLFMDISGDTLQQLDLLARREKYETGSTLYNIGDPTDDLYILESGRVEFLIGRDGTSPAGFVLHKGEVFGWAALLENQARRIAKATCLEDSVLLRLNGEETLKVLESDPASGYLVMRKLSTLITRHLGSQGEK